MKKKSITGNRFIDGLISIFIGLFLLGASILISYVYGSPVFWWKIFGGVLASFLIGLYAVMIFAGFVLFIAGLYLIIVVRFELIDKSMCLVIIFLSVLLASVCLTILGILSSTQYIEFMKWFITLVFSSLAGYYIGVRSVIKNEGNRSKIKTAYTKKR